MTAAQMMDASEGKPSNWTATGGREGPLPQGSGTQACGFLSAPEGRATSPTESVEQQRLFQWVRMASGAHPELQMLYHIPNEGKRSRASGARMRAEGLRRGVPDLCLPVARGGWHGLYIELKRVKGGRVSEEQAEWLQRLREEGYAAQVCNGWEEAARVLEAYLLCEGEKV